MSHVVTAAAPARVTWRRVGPAAAAVAVAALTAYDLTDASALAPVLAASGLVYLGAAALGRPVAAWPVFLLTFAVIALPDVVPAAPDPIWLLLGLTAPFLAYGWWRADGLRLQTAAMAVLGVAAAVALTLQPVAAAYLVAAGLAGHAAWDVYHHRVDRVVVRSMAEFCAVLDLLLAIALLVVAARA